MLDRDKPTVKRLRVVAHGKVQGVGFRDKVRNLAESLNVSGYARNKSDGSMEALFEGDIDAVDQMLAFCATGPDLARVARLDEIEEDVQGIAGFKVFDQ